MEYTFVGYMDLNFDTKDGGKVDGVNIFVLTKAENVVGFKAEKKFISRMQINKMNLNLNEFVNKRVNIFCDLKGNPVMIQLA